MRTHLSAMTTMSRKLLGYAVFLTVIAVFVSALPSPSAAQQSSTLQLYLVYEKMPGHLEARRNAMLLRLNKANFSNLLKRHAAPGARGLFLGVTANARAVSSPKANWQGFSGRSDDGSLYAVIDTDLDNDVDFIRIVGLERDTTVLSDSFRKELLENVKLLEGLCNELLGNGGAAGNELAAVILGCVSKGSTPQPGGSGGIGSVSPGGGLPNDGGLPNSDSSLSFCSPAGSRVMDPRNSGVSRVLQNFAEELREQRSQRAQQAREEAANVKSDSAAFPPKYDTAEEDQELVEQLENEARALEGLNEAERTQERVNNDPNATKQQRTAAANRVVDLSDKVTDTTQQRQEAEEEREEAQAEERRQNAENAGSPVIGDAGPQSTAKACDQYLNLVWAELVSGDVRHVMQILEPKAVETDCLDPVINPTLATGMLEPLQIRCGTKNEVSGPFDAIEEMIKKGGECDPEEGNICDQFGNRIGGVGAGRISITALEAFGLEGKIKPCDPSVCTPLPGP